MAPVRQEAVASHHVPLHRGGRPLGSQMDVDARLAGFKVRRWRQIPGPMLGFYGVLRGATVHPAAVNTDAHGQ